jgi:hypothetical protein
MGNEQPLDIDAVCTRIENDSLVRGVQPDALRLVGSMRIGAGTGAANGSRTRGGPVRARPFTEV